MLHFIYGRAGSGKTAYLREQIGDVIRNGGEPLLIVPEQFSFETERAMLQKLGAEKMRKLKVFGFSRLALSVLKDQIPADRPFLDDGLRAALMSETLYELQDHLVVYGRIGKNQNALQSLVDFVGELQLCGVTPAELSAVSLQLGTELLSQKLPELSLIAETYHSLVSSSYFDDTEALSCFNESEPELGYFAGKNVFVDSFRGFTKPELDCIGLAIREADDVTVTLCTDRRHIEGSPFEYMDHFETALRGLAAKMNVPVAPPVEIKNNAEYAAGIAAVENGIWSSEGAAKETVDDKSVIITQCADAFDECALAADEIKRLLREEGYRCREIAVIERSESVYHNVMINALMRLDIPVFDDRRRPVAFLPLIVLASSAIETILNHFDSECVFRCLKTGLCALSPEETAELEKYVLVWGISGQSWNHDFTLHPDGFGSIADEKSKKKLLQLNVLRKKAIEPFVLLNNSLSENKENTAEALYRFLQKVHADKRLSDLVRSLQVSSRPREAEENADSWNILMNLLDQMDVLTSGKNVSLKRWYTLFMLLVSQQSVGEIPQGLDEVTVGVAERIRTDGLRAVFLIGVNMDEFPLVSTGNGLLTDAERRELGDKGLELFPPYEERALEERFIAYCALTAATDKLYLSYRTSSQAEANAPSEIIDEIKHLLPDIVIQKSGELPKIDRIESEREAFLTFACDLGENTSLEASLFSYFSEKSEYRGKLDALKRASGNLNYKFSSPDRARRLFGDVMYLSASRVEKYYDCPFQYFCRYGLSVNPLRKASLDPAQSGTIIHYLLENVLRQYKGRAFNEVSQAELEACVRELLQNYLCERMGGFESKSNRFLFLYDRLVETVMTVFERLKNEFTNCDFHPCDFELSVGGAEVGAYELPLSDGGVLRVTGSIDRVDCMEADGVKYLRVVDYKTGAKKFRLSDLLDGLNIQMILYLMAIEKNGQSYYGKTVPAGVLYLPSRIGLDKYMKERDPSPEQANANKNAAGKLSGMLLCDPAVLLGCGVLSHPDYLPAGYTKGGKFSGNLFDLKDFDLLSAHVDSLLRAMGEKLHSGAIPALPYSKKEGVAAPCDYCDYRAVCGFEEGSEVRKLRNLRHNEAINALQKEGETDEKA